jgi:hypothetical protein
MKGPIVYFSAPEIKLPQKTRLTRHFAGIFTAAALLVSAPLLAQDGQQPGKAGTETNNACATGKCQHNVRITLKEKNGATFDRVFENVPPVVQPFGFGVIAGQTVYIEADVVDGKLVNLVSVDKISDPEKTITATFEQVDGKDMMLTITNPYQKMLKFSMGIVPLGQKRLIKTTSCPVGAGIRSVELWSDPISQVMLIGGHLLPDGSPTACVE